MTSCRSRRGGADRILDRDENMLAFEFNDETRQMLGYDGLEDLPDEFDSWVKTLVPEERDGIVKLFWDSVRAIAICRISLTPHTVCRKRMAV